MIQTKDSEPIASRSGDCPGDDLSRVTREIVRAIKSVGYGSVEIVIRNSRVVQIERKEKFRFD
jgi:hypothetical protein